MAHDAQAVELRRPEPEPAPTRAELAYHSADPERRTIVSPSNHRARGRLWQAVEERLMDDSPLRPRGPRRLASPGPSGPRPTWAAPNSPQGPGASYVAAARLAIRSRLYAAPTK